MVKLPRFINQIKCSLLAFFIPRHMKRILFLMALYQSTVQGTELTNKKLAELNKALKLAKTDPAALKYPATFTKDHFPSLTCKSLCEVSDEEINTLLEQLPEWMRYARSDDLKKDVLLLRKYAVQHA